MQATESLRSAPSQDLPSRTAPHTTRIAKAQPATEQLARGGREAFLYRCVVGSWMVLMIGFGILQLMGATNIR